tara:strand:+ start:3380 stop:4609 length:1230 start_codon:yes stop_codon:yes gene_type:complete
MKTTDIEVRRMRLRDLRGADYNPRTIEDAAYKGLRESIERFGMLEMPVVNVRDGRNRIVSGHQRVRALRDQGIVEADCIVVNFDDAAERVANLTMNNPEIRGTFDPLAFAEEVPDLSEGLLAGMLDEPFAQLDVLLDDIRDKATRALARVGTQADDDLEDASDEPVRSKVGKVYQLGRHRVYCGSYADGIPRIMGRAKADVVLADPPYNVDYASKDGDRVENDNLTPDEWGRFVRAFAKTLHKRVDGPCFVFMSSRELPLLRQAWEDVGGTIVRWLFWVKDRGGVAHGDYRTQSEICMMGWSAGRALDVGETCTNVFEAPRVGRTRTHPTQKPTALYRDLLASATQQGDRVLDPFAGSGTSVVVAEEMGLTCFACELEPRHVDTIRRRWAQQVHGADCAWTRKTPAEKT